MGKFDEEEAKMVLIGTSAYEGLLPKEIKSKRHDQGLDQKRSWDIWKDGCEGGESVLPLTGTSRY